MSVSLSDRFEEIIEGCTCSSHASMHTCMRGYIHTIQDWILSQPRCQNVHTSFITPFIPINLRPWSTIHTQAYTKYYAFLKCTRKLIKLIMLNMFISCRWSASESEILYQQTALTRPNERISLCQKRLYVSPQLRPHRTKQIRDIVKRVFRKIEKQEWEKKRRHWSSGSQRECAD